MQMNRLLTPWVLVFVLILYAIINSVASAQELTLPRFVSIKTDEANARVGPGKRYPIRWTFVTEGLPLEVVNQYGEWRQIRYIDGEEFWMHVTQLSSKRTVVLTGGTSVLWRKASIESVPLLHAEEGVIAGLLECKRDWCRIEVSGIKGWLKRTNLWGVYSNENIQ